MNRVSAALAALLLPALAGAAGTPGDLPDDADVRAAMESSPRLLAAIESVARGQAIEKKLSAGPHEWSVSATTQQRKDSTGQSHSEQEYGLQRGVRWPWKYSLDHQIGSLESQAGTLEYLDAWHEAGRDLLDLWFMWVQAEAQLQLAERQGQVVQSQRDTVARRVAAGDAATLELQLADAELQAHGAATSRARREVQLARQALAEDFPALAPMRPDLGADPPELSGTDAEWLEHITNENHEVELALALKDAASLAAQRAGHDRLADPTIGLRYSGNMDGDRKVVGLTFTLPLGGRGRSADAALARSESRRADAAARHAEDRVLASAHAAIADARESLASWKAQRSALLSQQAATEATMRGYSLGEFDIGILLAARRTTLQMERDLLDARVQAGRAHARVLLDAHEIWAPDESAHQETAHRP